MFKLLYNKFNFGVHFLKTLKSRISLILLSFNYLLKTKRRLYSYNIKKERFNRSQFTSYSYKRVFIGLLEDTASLETVLYTQIDCYQEASTEFYKIEKDVLSFYEKRIASVPRILAINSKAITAYHTSLRDVIETLPKEIESKQSEFIRRRKISLNNLKKIELYYCKIKKKNYTKI